MAEEKQVEINIEVCQNCQLHSWCTHHDEKRYHTLFDEIKALLETNIADCVVVKNKYKKEPTTGAFEISYKGIIIYSKKFTGLFPNPVPTAERVQRFLQDVKDGNDTSKYAKLPEKKYEAPRKPKEKLTFQTFMKQKEEEEKKKKSSENQVGQQEQQQDGEQENEEQVQQEDDQVHNQENHHKQDNHQPEQQEQQEQEQQQEQQQEKNVDEQEEVPAE